jgi:8-oxo-dGTP diphosphatase
MTKIFMKQEFSAGGIVYKKEHGKLFILLAQHSYHHGWVFPKGLIGDNIAGEGKEETAIREVEEETGAKAKIIKALEPATFWYVFEGEKRKKTVYYYIMEYLGGDITQHDFEMENVEWLPEEDVEKRLTYKTDKKVWMLAKKGGIA